MKNTNILREGHLETAGMRPGEDQTSRFMVLAVLSALLLFPYLHGRGLAGYDDSYFAHEGKEMVRTGNWWDVQFNGDLILSHPPVFPWLEASSFKLFGINDAAAKLPSVLLGWGTILLMYFLGLELTGDAWCALLSMLVLASTQFFLKNASHAMTDVPFTFFFTLAIFFYLKGLKDAKYLTLIGVPLALAILTRSVVGLLALGIMLVHLVLTRRYATLLSSWWICGVVLALALAAPWYVSQYFLHGRAFFVSHLQFLNSKIHMEEGPSYWGTLFNYPLALLRFYWPWLPFLIAGLVMQTRTAVKGRNSNAILLLAWVVITVVPFTLAQARYPRYIMCAFPAFSILSAMALMRWVPERRGKIFFRTACAVGCVAVVLFLLFPAKGRADDMIKIAPIAEANSLPDQRIFIYTYANRRDDFLYQFVWYSNRYAQLAPDLETLAADLLREDRATVIIDKRSYEKLLPQIAFKNPQVLGESQNLLCFKIS